MLNLEVDLRGSFVIFTKEPLIFSRKAEFQRDRK